MDSRRIIHVIEDFCKEANKHKGYCVLTSQLKMYPANFPGTSYADQQSLLNQYEYAATPHSKLFKGNLD
jgi:hypothetical protein